MYRILAERMGKVASRHLIFAEIFFFEKSAKITFFEKRKIEKKIKPICMYNLAKNIELTHNFMLYLADQTIKLGNWAIHLFFR